MGAVLIAYRIAYSSPIWLDCSGVGTLKLVLQGSLSLYQIPLPAYAVVSPLCIQDPSMYASIGAPSMVAVLGALVASSCGALSLAVKTLKQFLRESSMWKGFKVCVVLFL